MEDLQHFSPPHNRKHGYPVLSAPMFALVAGYSMFNWDGWFIADSGYRSASDGVNGVRETRNLCLASRSGEPHPLKGFDVQVRVTRKAQQRLHGVGSTA